MRPTDEVNGKKYEKRAKQGGSERWAKGIQIRNRKAYSNMSMRSIPRRILKKEYIFDLPLEDVGIEEDEKGEGSYREEGKDIIDKHMASNLRLK